MNAVASPPALDPRNCTQLLDGLADAAWLADLSTCTVVAATLQDSFPADALVGEEDTESLRNDTGAQRRALRSGVQSNHAFLAQHVDHLDGHRGA